MMDHEQLMALGKQMLKPKRYEHTLRVADESARLAKLYGADSQLAKTAGYLHDIAKNLTDEKLAAMLRDGGEAGYLGYSPYVWHAPAGALFSKEHCQVHNKDILDAIKYHCTGRAEMGLLESIVFLADYIEPNRKQPGVEEIRKVAETSLEAAIAKTLANTVAYLKAKGEELHPDTLKAYAHYHHFLET
ncbi:MAG: bis(5'-nucleosyl)-tetraphosphatase (symmetrical) YqeK [Turicibacter sp.]|nr:bis(5'-nucleosyl)-tetraphosphatase (symmetrical) YqeK [Turicibacter sp.]